MDRRRLGFRIAAALVAVIIVVVLVAIAGLRLSRKKAGPAQPVRGDVVHVRNGFTDIYGARTGDKVIVFDAGIDPDGRPLDTLLAALGATRDDVAHVFLTHGHFDHLAAVPLCGRATVHLGAADFPLASHRDLSIPVMSRLMAGVLGSPPVEPNAALPGLAAIGLDGDKELLAIPAPGHTAGSFLFLYGDVLIAGDSIVIDGDHLEFAAPRFSASVAENRRSIAALRRLLLGRKVEVVCTGHQGCTPEGKGGAMLEALIARAETER